MHQRTKIAIAVAMALPVLAPVAHAQTEPLQRVEVTGSRIRQVDLETAQPVLKVTAEQIQNTGLNTVGDILNQLTASAPPTFSRGSTLASDREQGGQYIDMRNLGAQRLLVLVDGKRWTQSINGYTDLSTVPTSLVERIEILKDGGSSIYGSDAIAGVVNIILKKKLDGGQLSVYRGMNKSGDGRNDDFSLAYGASGEKSSVMFGLSYTEQGTVWAKDRAITASGSGPDHLTAGLGGGPYARIRNVLPNGAAGSTIDLNMNHTGDFQNPGTGFDSRNLANYHRFSSSNVNDSYNTTQDMMFQTPTKLTSIFTKGTLELPYGMQFSTTAMYADRKSSTQNGGYPLTSQTKVNFPVYVSRDSYYNPYGSSIAGNGAGQDLYFNRRITEVPRVTENNNQTLHLDAVLSGEFELIGKAWSWDVGYNHSNVKGTTYSTGNLNLINLKNALGASFRNAAGVVQCGTAASPIPLSQCVPFDIIGGPSASSQAALDYVMTTGRGIYGSTTNSATANVSGELFNLPAGAVGIAGGFEHREQRGYDEPDELEQRGYTTALGAKTTRGKYSVREAYLEANFPLLKDVFLAKSLSANVATRHSDYSNFGTTNNSKVSFMWKPIDDVLLRGTYAEGFRAPALDDTFGGGGTSYDTYLDICDSRFGQAATNASIRANCAAAGVPATFRQVNATGAMVAGASGIQTPFPFDTGVGNKDLTPETATTKTLGLVYSPSFVRGLTTTLDWFKIRVDNRITSVTVKYTLEQCYINNNPQFCNNIVRGETGQITNLRRGNLNLGALETEGVDIGFNYRLPRNDFGQFVVRSESTWVKSYKIKASAEADWDEYVSEYLYNRFKSNASIDWTKGNWNATYTMRYQSAVKDDCWDPVDGIECSNPDGQATFGAYNRLGSQTFSDLTVGYALPWKGKIQIGVNNIWNKKPRIAYRTSSSGASVDPDLPLERFVYFRYNQSF